MNDDTELMHSQAIATFQYGANFKVIGKCDPQNLSYVGAFITQQGRFADLARHINKGHPWMSALLDEGATRCNSSANYTELISLDIDSGYSMDAASVDPFIVKHCGLAIESNSSTPENHKFRLVFRLTTPLIGAEKIKIVLRYLMDLYPQADKACKDPCRFFFGAKDRQPFILNENAFLPASFVEQAGAWWAKQERQKAKQLELSEIALQKRRENYDREGIADDTDQCVEMALSYIPQRVEGTGTYDVARDVTWALCSHYGTERAAQMMEAHSPSHGNWNPATVASQFKEGQIKLGTLFHLAKLNGFKMPSKPKKERESRKASKPKPPTMADIAKREGIEVKDETYFVNLVQLCDRPTKAILQGTAKDIDRDKLIDAYKELRAWENVALKFAPDTMRYVKGLTIMRKLCSERFHMGMHKDFESIPNQASLMPSLYYEGGNDAINKSFNRMWKMKITPVFEDDTEGKKAKAFEANELKNLRMRVESAFRSNLKYNVEIKEWFEYKDGLWKRIDIAEVEAESRQLLHDLTCSDDFLEGVPPTKKQIAEFMNRIQHSVQIKKFDADNEYPDLINLKDCVLNRKTRELLPHDRKYNFTWQLPYNWSDRHKGCDVIMSWLDWVFEGDDNKIMLMLCFLNAIVTQRSDLQKFMQIIGQGGTGKSTFSIVARALVGIENCRSTQMTALEGNRFEGANLYGKRLLIISEADSYTGDAPMIKNITGGDPIRYEVKGIQSRLDFVFNGKLLIVANKPFEPKEADSAWYRRVINVPFNREVPLDQKESLLEIQGDRFVGKFEPYIAGLLDKVLSISDETVKEFLEKTSKYVPSLDAHKSEMILYSNPLAQWCEENLVLLPTAKTHIGDGKKQSISTEMQGGVRINHTKYEDSDKLLYPNYCQFCIYRGNNPISYQNFSRRLVELFNDVLKVNTVKKGTRDGKGMNIIGLAIRTPDHANIPTPIKKTLLNNVDLMTGNVDLMKAENIASEGSVDYVGFF